ncbi:uncharacterized protein LOC110978359 [Acanthaster planci]|uniref:Uncharacterized protein LOC110978359 n=1 Tax=Acanthaster planci TaxID=133434 RepID=A0A8B7Y9F6_ACAPL|nr:uncharacterized protein LOC110978359 [Acanthaster planci]XP_022088991.1 uncharacterized protein LOC110978359 [Acanthaster planci]
MNRMDVWSPVTCRLRFLLLTVLELSLLQSVITVLHGGEGNGYALPRPFSGCTEHWVDFRVLIRYSNITGETDISKEFKIGLDTVDDNTILFEFCVQNNTLVQGTMDDPVIEWPAGQYCIQSVGQFVRNNGRYEWVLGDCPQGFKSGVTALPFTTYPGQRMSASTSPLSLTYRNRTLIHYCCSTNGDVNTPIDLGMAAPFFLLPYGEPRCQKVHNMDSELQYIEWPAAVQQWTGVHPYSVRGRKFFYCYYTPLGLGMEHDIIRATFAVSLGTPTVTVIIICLCKLRAKLMARRRNFKRFQSVM